MKREGDISIVQAIEQEIKQYGRYKLLKDGGSEHEYDEIGCDAHSAKFCRKYRIYCSKYQVLKGFFDVLIDFDYRIGRGRLVIKDSIAGPFCNVIPHIGDYMYKLQRYFSNNQRR